MVLRVDGVSQHGVAVAVDFARRLNMLEGLGILVGGDEPLGELRPVAQRPGALKRFLEERDDGYSIRNTDMEAGLIFAYVARRSFGFLGIAKGSDTGFEVSCIINAISEQATEVRFNIRKTYEGDRSVTDRM
jgi:hypothetical protein